MEEMEGRSQSFAAFGAHEHWLNQLLPMHLPLAARPAKGSGKIEGTEWRFVLS